jgi:hypothetical protein
MGTQTAHSLKFTEIMKLKNSNMKRLINTTSIICTIFLVFSIVSCEEGGQGTAPTISTDNYPTVTITANQETNKVKEGDTLTYTIKSDKPLEPQGDATIDFSLNITGGTANAEDVESNLPVTYPTFVADTSVTAKVIFPIDNIPEKDEKISYKIKDADVFTKYSLNSNSKFASADLTIQNVNNPNGLTIALNWNGDAASDMDMYALLFQGGNYVGALTDGASGDKPEILVNTYPQSGVWYYALDAADYKKSPISYKFMIGYPDQSVKIIEGTYDVNDSSRVGPQGLERFLKITATANGSGGLKYSVKNLNPSDSTNNQSSSLKGTKYSVKRVNKAVPSDKIKRGLQIHPKK